MNKPPKGFITHSDTRKYYIILIMILTICSTLVIYTVVHEEGGKVCIPTFEKGILGGLIVVGLFWAIIVGSLFASWLLVSVTDWMVTGGLPHPYTGVKYKQKE